jgi:hypothetical protein
MKEPFYIFNLPPLSLFFKPPVTARANENVLPALQAELLAARNLSRI